jgi:hypothetical protein
MTKHKREPFVASEALRQARQQYHKAAQTFYDELCRASEHQAALDGVVLGGFVTRYGLDEAAQVQNLFVVVGFSPVVYHGLCNGPTQNAPNGTWSAWVRAVSPTGRFTRDSRLYYWCDCGPVQYQLYPGSKKVKRVQRSVEPALWEEK